MRVLLIALLIVLLPIRGWSAERMAVYMAGTSMQNAMQSAMPDDCPMKMVAETGKPSADSGHTSERGCQACQLCMVFASFGTPMLNAPAAEPVSHVLPAADRFASVDLAPLPKPPIY